MARRLNQEAGKTIKYGGVSELDAWKMVTINPAKLLHIDNRVGSIKEGKDADLVLWTDHPLIGLRQEPKKPLSKERPISIWNRTNNYGKPSKTNAINSST